MRPRYYDESWGRWGLLGNSLVERDRGFYRLHGMVATPHGYVYVAAINSGRIPGRDDKTGKPWKKWGPVTRLYFIRDGREKVRDYPRILTSLAAIRAARSFAKECAR